MAILPFTSLLTGSSTPLLASADVVAFVDVSDLTQSAQGSTVKATLTQFFAAVPVPIVVTSASVNALAVGLAGATNSAFQVDASTALQAAGLKVTGAVAAGTVAVVVISSGSNANLSVNAKGSGTIAIGSVSTGAVTITPALTLVSTLTFSAVTARIISGATNFGINNSANTLANLLIDDATGAATFRSSLAIVGALTGATTGAFSSNVTVGGTLGVTGIATFTAAPVFSSGTASQTVELNSGKALTTVAITGTGNYVKSASPTLTGTIAAASATFSGTVGVTGVATFTAQPILSSLTASQAVFTDASKGLVSNAITGSGNVVMSASPTLTGTITCAAISASGDFAIATSKFTVAAASGDVVLAGTITFSSTTARLVSGATNFGLNNSANTLANLLIDDASGDTTLRGAASIKRINITGTSNSDPGRINFATSGNLVGFGDGDVWYDGTNFRCRTGGAVKTFTIT